RDVTAGAIRTVPAGDPATGSIAILAGRDINAATLAAGEDIALSGGGTLAFTTARAGDDIDLATSGTVSLVSAVSTGAGSDARAVQFDRTLAGQPAAIAFAGTGGQAGHNIAIRAAALTSPTPLGGETGTGLVVRSLAGGTDATLTADQGDIRIGTIDASGNIGVAAGQGSVSGLDSSWISPAPAAGGPTLQAPGAILLESVGAGDFAIGSAIAATISTGAGAPANLRLGVVRAGSLDLTAGARLQIDDAQITGTASLRTTGGTAGAFNLTGPALVDGHGRAGLSGADILVTAAGAAQLGTVSADRDIDVTAAAIDLSEATAALGLLSLEAGSGRLTLGTGSAGTDAILVKEDDDIGLPRTAADNLLTAGSVTAGGAASFRSRTSAAIGTATAAAGDLTVNAKDDASLGSGTAVAGAIRILAGHDATATTLAAEDIAVRAGNDANLGTLTAGDDLDLEAGAALTIVSGSTLGAGADDRSFAFDPALAGADTAITLAATPAADGDIRAQGGSVTLGRLDSAIGNIGITATTGDVASLAGEGSVAVHGAGKTISVRATAGNVQLGPLSAGQGSSVLVGTQIDVTAQVIDLLTATATNGALILTATEGSLTLGTGTAGGGATLVKQGSAGELTVTSLTAAQDITVQSQTSARLGTLQSTDGSLAFTTTGGDLTLDSGTAGAGATLIKQGAAGELTVTSLTAAQDIMVQSQTSARLGTLQSTDGSLAFTTTGGDLTLDSGTAGAGATLIKQGTTGELTVTSLTAAQDISIQSQTSARLGTLQSTNGALALTATGGDLALGTGTAGGSATLIKQGATGELTVTSLIAAQGIAAQSQTNARLGTLQSGNGSIAVLAQGQVTGLTPTGAGVALDAFEDAAISAGGEVRIDTARAGDDLSIETPGAVYLVSAVADGSAGDTRTITFDRTRIGQPGGIAFDAPAAIAPLASPAGSNITIRAASLGGPALTGDTDTGLVIGTLDSGAAALSSAQGDIRVDTITASGGDIEATATNGSVTGRRTGFQSATGGSTISAQGQLILDVSGDVAAGSVTAGTVTNAGQATPGSIRLGSVDAGTLTLTAANGLQIDSATVSGTATLGTTGGAANASASGYGTAAMTAQGSIAVDAAGTAQLGALQAGQITVKASAARIGSARALNGDISIEAKTALSLLGVIETVDPGRTVTLSNTGTGGTIIGGTTADNGSDIVLDNAEIALVSSGNLVIDSKARPVAIDRLTIAGNTGRTSFRILSTGAIVLNDTISGDGTGVLQIGGSSTDDPSGLVDETKLATQIAADIGDSGTRAAILLPNGTVDLRARRIVFARTGLIDRYLPASGTSPSDAAVALDVANAASPLYTSDGTGRQFLTAKRLKVSYANFALFQNTGGPNGGGVALNETAPPTVTGLALQLFGPGDRTDNSFALFGTINGFIGRGAGILPNEIIEIWAAGGNPRVVRIAQGNARLNGCVIGSPDKGCLVNDPPRPNFSIYDQRQTQLFGMADDPLLFFNPLVGRGNEGLIVDIADAPVGIDTIECDPANGPCPQGEPK
ncbi:hypothetical protein, partial [Sphingomonas sp. dw_22]|uniref:beta strand repeat-containing protein n=1 Tax=Sphingomonas sp. dw_22 TaxID=2721175 RepID=UPI001BD3AA43